MNNFDYKKYSLENLEKWMSDALTSAEATPNEIYDVIKGVVDEEYHYFKNQTSRCYELLELLNGNGNFNLSEVLKEREYYEGCDTSGESKLTCDKNDKSPECQSAWNDFWEENYYPEEHKVEDIMPPWGHSDMEALRYSEEELNAMCDKATSDDNKKRWKVVGEDKPYPIHVSEDGDVWIPDSVTKEDKVVKWQLPVEVDGLTGDCLVQFPDDLLEAANLKEGDTVEWIDRKDGSFELRKVNGIK
jgi:hypothetical protein